MKYFLSVIYGLLLVNVVVAQQDFDPYNYTIQKTFRGRNGAVVSAHPLASKVGVMILKKGGNAIDAAIATKLALAVVYPGAGNIGGGGFMVAHLNDGRNITLDFREKAPGKAHRDMYLDSAGNADLDKSQYGHLAAGVPGSVAGLFAAHTYALLPFRDLIAPAIELAEKGFTITEEEAEGLNSERENFLKYNTTSTVFTKKNPWKAGDTLVQKDLANTLRRISKRGQKGFYSGKTAKLLVAEMKRGGGIISRKDLKDYKAVSRNPSAFKYKGYDVVTMPLPSSGGVLLPMMLKMTDQFPIAEYGFHSLKAVQLMTEIERLAYADRAFYLGDEDYYKVPVAKLTSDAYIKERLRLYKPDTAGNSKSIREGSVEKESEETTHLSIVDNAGNAVAITTTLNGGYGACTVVGGAGFLLNNEMDDFSVKPGVPNMFGAIGGEANAIVAGKRMLSSMTPTIVLKNGKPYIVAGTPGGTTITTSVYQTLVNMIDFNMSTFDAVNKPKFHMQWSPDILFLEKDFPMEISAALEKMGYEVKRRGQIGRTEVIKILEDGTIEAVGDRRGDDAAEGF